MKEWGYESKLKFRVVGRKKKGLLPGYQNRPWLDPHHCLYSPGSN